MKKTYHFVAISGSIRKGSYNTMVLNTLQSLTPKHIKITQLLIDDLPFYNFDLHEKEFPVKVEKLNGAIKKSDGIIFVSPEYNYSVPGVLKNAIQIMVSLNSYVLNEPEIMIGKVNEKFGADGKLSDEGTKNHLIKFIDAFAEFSDRFA